MSFKDQGPPLPRLAVYLCYVVLSTISLTKVPTKMVDLTCKKMVDLPRKSGWIHLPELENWGFTDLSQRKIGISGYRDIINGWVLYGLGGNPNVRKRSFTCGSVLNRFLLFQCRFLKKSNRIVFLHLPGLVI